MTDFKPGDVVLVPFPFSDLSRAKPRPALVLGSQLSCEKLPDLILCQITSKKERYLSPKLGDVPLKDWGKAGLPLQSTVRVVKLATLSKETVFSRLGSLTSSDMERVVSAFLSIFSFPTVRK
jgi:mRNA interferase MazF